MSGEYTNNHYVPDWYQRRFIPSGQRDQELYYLNLQPEIVYDARGQQHTKRSVHRQGPRKCFAMDNLYTANFGTMETKDVEKYFFGSIDARGRRAVEYFTNFAHPSVDGVAFQDMVLYMSTQKLRTPKGLGWLSQRVGTRNHLAILGLMLRLRQLYCAAWTECIWQIADASQSNVKFIISDHPVTVYNRVCGPRSARCRGFNDPDIWLNGSHIIFPLSLEKVLILTHLSWVRNPYQSELEPRPNPNPFRGAIFKFLDIQTMRHLSEQEVIDINYIIKRRSLRYIAAGKEEWLYPEKRVSTTRWNEYGYGYMLMPDPRPVHLGGEIVIGHHDGTASWFDEYGRRPWQTDPNKDAVKQREFETLYRFQGEFARLHGPYRRGRTFQVMHMDPERDGDDFHKYHLDLERKHSPPRRVGRS